MEQGTDAWFAARSGRVTASALSNVMMKRTTAGYSNYKAQIICERVTGRPTETFTSAAMSYGTDTEPMARAVYEMETGIDVVEVGFIAHPTIEWSGASPDGLVGDSGLIEIKCPQPKKHIANLMGGCIDRGYMLQMQWQMECTGRDWCDFVSFNDTFPEEMRIKIERVNKDLELVSEISQSVVDFLTECETEIGELRKRYTK
jgi:putative phage-type endonuclease